jgi:hypothetical protein
MGQVILKSTSDLLELASVESDVAQQPHLPKITKQFEPRVRLDTDHMNVGRTMIVGKDHHAPAAEVRKDSRHGSI